MTNKLKKANLRRLASLSALGAGALGVGAGTAEAGAPGATGIVWSGIIDEKVGWAAGYGARATIVGPNGAAGVLFKSTYILQFFTLSRNTFHAVNAVSANPQPHGTTFRILDTRPFNISHFYPQGRVWAFPRGSRFGSRTTGHVQAEGLVAQSWKSFSGRTAAITNFNPTNRYLLFRFTGGQLTHPIYGWAHLSVSLAGQLAGPNVTLVDYAYNLTGKQIPAGYRGLALDGDEGAFARSGLSAVSLGAAGIRNWRTARQAETAKH